MGFSAKVVSVSNCDLLKPGHQVTSNDLRGQWQ